jgi:hypothetical protein
MVGSLVKLKEKKLKDVKEYLKAECSHCNNW